MNFLEKAIHKDITGAAAAFQDWDISSYIPSWARCAVLISGGARKNGSAQTNNLCDRKSVYFVETDSNRVIEIYGGAANGDHWLLGYGVTGEVIERTSTDITPAGTTGWQSVDVAAALGLIGTPPAFWLVRAAAATTQTAGARHPSETVNISGSLSAGGSCIIVTPSATGLVSLFRDNADVTYRVLASLHTYYTLLLDDPELNWALTSQGWTDQTYFTGAYDGIIFARSLTRIQGETQDLVWTKHSPQSTVCGLLNRYKYQLLYGEGGKKVILIKNSKFNFDVFPTLDVTKLHSLDFGVRQ